MTTVRKHNVELNRRIKEVEKRIFPSECNTSPELEVFKCRLKILTEDEILTLVDWLRTLDDFSVECKNVFDAFARYADFGVPDLNREFLVSAIQVLAGAIDRPPRPDLSTVHFSKRPKIQADWARIAGVAY